jgi:hypothetical protein
MRRVVSSFAVAVGVWAVTGLAATVLASAWTWSALHSGNRTEGARLAFYLVTLCAIVVPPVLGIIAGRATYRSIGKADPDAQ